MKRILFATPYKTATGGISQWADNLISYYDEHRNTDCELEVLPMNYLTNKYPTIGKSFRERVLCGVQTYTNVLSTLKEQLNTKHYDILHISSSASLGLLKDVLMIRLAKKHNVKTIVHFHFGRIPQLIKSKGWEYHLLMHVIRKVNRVVVMDKASYDALTKIGVKNVILVPNPLSMSVERIINKNLTIERKQNTVLFVGHVVKNKGVFELVEACRDIENISLKLVGPVPDSVNYELKKIIAGENNIQIVGLMPMEDVIKEMLACNVFVLPSYTEGFPNVIIESMASACPIIATPVGAVPEMLEFNTDRQCGLSVDVKNVSQLKEAIIKLLQNPELANRMGNMAKVRVRNEYAVDVVWGKLVNIWQTI